MYTVNYWRIILKNQSPDLEKYTIHVVAETLAEARELAESRYGPGCLSQDPYIDNPK